MRAQVSFLARNGAQIAYSFYFNVVLKFNLSGSLHRKLASIFFDNGQSVLGDHILQRAQAVQWRDQDNCQYEDPLSP
jgi:hypothetical protein